MKKAFVIPLLLSSVLAAVGCGGNSIQTAGTDTGSKDSGAKQEINVAFPTEPEALDPSKATAEESFTMLNMFEEGLYRLDKDGKPQPAMADGMPQISADGKTYTIKLKTNVKWADGSPVTAQDFVYSWDRTLDPATKSEYAFMPAMWIVGADDYSSGKTKTPDKVGVIALDDHTLQVQLINPVSFFTSQLAFPIFFPEKKDFVEKYGDKFGADADKVLANGPFVLKNWGHEQSLEFDKNPNYWDASSVKLDKVTYQIVADQNTSMNLYQTNSVDIAEINRDQVLQYKGKPDYMAVPTLFSYDLYMNEVKYAPFKNVNIRKAITLGIDRQALVDTVLGNGSTPSAGYVPKGTQDGNNQEFRSVAGDTEPKFDAAQAKQLLAQGLKELNLTKLPPIQLLGDDDETAKKTIEFIQGQLKQNLGVDSVVNSVPKKLRLQKQTAKDFDMIAPSRWGADYNDPMTFLNLWLSNAETNYVGYKNPEYDKLVNAANVEADGKKRSDDLVQAEKILMNDMPIGPLYDLGRSFLRRPNLQDVLFPQNGPEFEFKWASVK